MLHKLLFLLDPERTHRLVVRSLQYWSRWCAVDFPQGDASRHPSLRRALFGLTFPNPLGLAAGFDKDAEAVVALQCFGFGFIEVGTVTAIPQEGNLKPRLFRLPQDQALFNRLGFNNAGAVVVAKRIEGYRQRGRIVVPIGVNIGKSKMVSLEEAPKDYVASFQMVADVADYVAVNVSSPNTPGLRDLQEEGRLATLLDHLATVNQKRATPRPLILKLSPDTTAESAIGAVEVALARSFQGVIVSNTTIAQDGLTDPFPEGTGGISGKPLFQRSTDLLRTLKGHFGDRTMLIGVGGIMTAEDAKIKLAAGADLLQMYTGFVYGGPQFPRRVLKVLQKERI